MATVNVDMQPGSLSKILNQLDEGGIAYEFVRKPIGLPVLVELVLDGDSDVSIVVRLNPDGTWTLKGELAV